MQIDWAGRERCEILQEIEEELNNFDSIPQDQKNSLLWAIDYLLKLYRCRT